MKIVLIQVLLIAVIVVVAVRLFQMRGARAQALRRLGLAVFAGFAIVSILFPNVWNAIARLVGVGRGTDMVLYGLVIAFLSYVVTVYSRFRQTEAALTQLARRIAIDEAVHARADEPPTPPTPPRPPIGPTL